MMGFVCKVSGLKKESNPKTTLSQKPGLYTTYTYNLYTWLATKLNHRARSPGLWTLLNSVAE